MPQTLDAERTSSERAQELIAAARALGPEFEAAARQAETERKLPLELVAKMREARLFWMKSPLELGGSELDPLDFCDVVEEIAYHDASAAWATMIGNGTTGTIAGWVPEEGIREIFGSEQLPIFAGQYVPRGKAVPVEGGYRVSGRWTFCSGIPHADWVVGGARVEGSSEILLITAPKSAATVHDTWFVAGLQGTGSNDFSLEDEFVPAYRTMRLVGETPKRGGALYQQPQLVFLSNELPPIAVGIARRALDDMLTMAKGTARQIGGASLADRAAFQKTIGRVEAKWRSARLLYRDAVAQSWDLMRAGLDIDDELSAAFKARHTFVVETCTEVVAEVFRYGGGRVLSLDNPMQRHYRNLIAATQHVYLTEENFELAGKATLEHLSPEL